MPISVIADNKYICMHGGISRELKKIEDISKIDRFVEPPLKGLLCDLLWADPCDDKDAPKIEYGARMLNYIWQKTDLKSA